jgi:hydrogenase maturation protein HypF
LNADPAKLTGQTSGQRRLRLEVSGAVQGVGFRPFLYRAATGYGLQGWIRNDPQGVTLELEGPVAALERFVGEVRRSPPPRAVVHEVREEWLPAIGLNGLSILSSDRTGERLAAVLPDLATCDACLADIGLGPSGDAGADRRRAYPFTNCTDCGPRFSIIRALPYDRANTTMAGFELCPDCREEYENPLDRRFHAQPTACPRCGPRLRAVVHRRRAADVGGTGGAGPGEVMEEGETALSAAVEAIRAGQVVALKGLGGFHLVVDAADEAAVAALRERKRRPTRPLALMVTGLEMAGTLCEVSPDAAALLSAPEAPIVLLPRKPGASIANGVAPGNPYLGLMLPYTPLHHLVMKALDRPVVATSGNLSDESICTDDDEAFARLGGIADLFLVHDRPIERPVDDSVVQWLGGGPGIVRRSRGYAPLPVRLEAEVPPILAVGGQLKNTIALARGADVFLSQHIGDLDSPESQGTFRRVVEDFLRLYEVVPEATAHDTHPDYAATGWAMDHGSGRRIAVQHHHAHLAACMADAGVQGPTLGVVWDGTGLGPDGTIWGGEFLLGDAGGYRRVAHLRPFRLPGGDAAVKEPRRMALALLHGAGDAGEAVSRLRTTPAADSMADAELRVLERVLDTGFRAPWTTSAGRLFDGVASLIGLRQRVDHEGEAAMALEYIADPAATGAYPFALIEPADGAERAGEGDRAPLVLDWTTALDALLTDQAAGVPAGVLSARFHNGLVAAILAVAERAGVEQVALTGGCFQNRVLTDGAAAALRGHGFRPILHRRVPPNDGGLALGQVAVAAAVLARPGQE